MTAILERKKHSIDLTGRVVGRVATEIAVLLQGKHKISFVPNRDMGDFVEVKNASQLQVTGRKSEQKEYRRFTGYPGGLRSTLFKDLIVKDPAKVLRNAVYHMLPKNKLRLGRMKRLTFIR